MDLAHRVGEGQNKKQLCEEDEATENQMLADEALPMVTTIDSGQESTDTYMSKEKEEEEEEARRTEPLITEISCGGDSLPSSDGQLLGSINTFIVGRDGESFTIVEDSEEEQEEEEEDEQQIEEEQEVNVTSSLRSHLLVRRMKSEDDFAGVC